MSEDKVIEHVHVEQLPCLDDGFGEGNIVLRRRRIAAGMVVRERDGEGVPLDGFTEDLGDTGRRSVDRTSVERRLCEHVVLGVQHEQSHFFLLEQLHLRLQKAGDVVRAMNGWSQQFALQSGPASEFEEGGDGGCLGRAETVYLAEGVQVSRSDTTEPAVLGEQATGKGEDIFSGGAGAEDDGKQLGGGECAGTEPL